MEGAGGTWFAWWSLVLSSLLVKTNSGRNVIRHSIILNEVTSMREEGVDERGGSG